MPMFGSGCGVAAASPPRWSMSGISTGLSRPRAAAPGCTLDDVLEMPDWPRCRISIGPGALGDDPDRRLENGGAAMLCKFHHASPRNRRRPDRMSLFNLSEDLHEHEFCRHARGNKRSPLSGYRDTLRYDTACS